MAVPDRGGRGRRAGIGGLRTGLFGKVEYWTSMGIVVGFQVIADGWMTTLPTPIVICTRRDDPGDRS